MTCLMKWWLASSCRAEAEGSPLGQYGTQNIKYWDIRKAGQVQGNMRYYAYNAYRGNSKDGVPFLKLCYGLESTVVTTNDLELTMLSGDDF